MKRIALFLALLLLLASCAPPPGDRAEFDAFADRLDAERAARSAWSEEERAAFQSITAASAGRPDPFTEEELRALVTERDKTSVRPEEAAEDVETFFLLLQSAYGGYEYFGGDGVFFPIRDELLEALDGERGNIQCGELGERLYKALSPVIVDRHFRLDKDRVISARHERAMFYVPDLYFSDPAGLDPAFVRRTIGPDGALSYCFAALAASRSKLPEEAALQGETVQLTWSKAQEYPDSGSEVAAHGMRFGLPVLTCGTMTANSRTEGPLERLAASGASYRGRPAFVVDLRGNGGGNDSYGAKWVKGFTGAPPCVKDLSAQKCSSAYLAAVKWSDQYAFVRGRPETEDLLAQLEENLGGWETELQDGVLADSGGSVQFVLIDRGTASAGEGFARMLASIRHTVMVGSNTSGCLQFGNVSVYYLPNSGLPVQMGSKISFYEDMELKEGSGILPDLWVPPPDALDAVERLCAYYGLQ